VRNPALGGDLTSVKCKGEWIPLGITVDPISGLALTIDALAAQDIKVLKDWIEPIAKSVGVVVPVTDDADGFKTVADEVGVHTRQGRCKPKCVCISRPFDRKVDRNADTLQRTITVPCKREPALGATGRTATNSHGQSMPYPPFGTQ